MEPRAKYLQQAPPQRRGGRVQLAGPDVSGVLELKRKKGKMKYQESLRGAYWRLGVPIIHSLKD